MKQEHENKTPTQRSNAFWKRLEELQEEFGVELEHEDGHGEFLLLDADTQERICYGWRWQEE